MGFLSRSRRTAIPAVVRRHTGIDLAATRAFLLSECFIPGRGFRSQYVEQSTVSCTTSAICIYALSRTGTLTRRQAREFERVLLAFRLTEPADQAGAFRRTTGETASAWTTAQAALALLGLDASWDVVRPSVEWLLRTQSTRGGWNHPGTNQGHERLVYTFYPTLVLVHCRRRLGKRAADALARVAAFLESCEERYEPFWIPLRRHLHRLVGPRRGTADVSLDPYGQLFEDAWPSIRVDDDWLALRFNMALMCGPNYLHLRGELAPDDPVSLLHVRHLADDRIGHGWNDRREPQPKTWATALGMLTLHRWAQDLARVRPSLRRLPTRSELFARMREGTAPAPAASKAARSLIRRFEQLRAGAADATAYQTLILETFAFVFGDALKDPKPQSPTFLGTLRRDVTFRNAADSGPWFDWKSRHKVASVLIECKNQNELSHDDLRQTACYLGRVMGRLAILACRRTTVDDARELLNWFVNNDDKYILVVNDETLIDWIRLKDRGGAPTDAIADLYRSLQEGVQ